MAATVENIVGTGADLLEAKRQLGHGRFTRMVENDLGMSMSTASRFMSIAKNDALSKCAHVQSLPASWGTLAELARIDATVLEHAIETGEVRADMERSGTTSRVSRRDGRASKS